MAIQKNPIFDGYRGSVNQRLLVRQCGGKTVVSKWPDRSNVVYSPLQLDERKRFKDAVAFARVIVKLPLLKARYSNLALKLGFRSAWNVAIAKYMSKNELQQKPRKIWFDSTLLGVGFGKEYRVKLYQLVYPARQSKNAEIDKVRQVFVPKIVSMWPSCIPCIVEKLLYGNGSTGLASRLKFCSD